MQQQRIKVYGPPGTGKTSYCLDLLCEHLEAQDRVLFLSFTRAAKLEAESRVLRAFGSVPDSATVKTIHSLCLSVLGIKVDNLFERFVATKKFYEKLDVRYVGNSKHKNKIAEALAYHNLVRNTGMEISDDRNTDPFTDPANKHQIVDIFEVWKANEGYVDFTDLLIRVANGEGTVPDYDVVIIDEAQDLTTLQWKVVDRLYAKSKQVYVVGDDDQAIYSFMGANVAAFLAWRCDAIKTLGYTYRLPKNILDFSMRLAVQIEGRQRKIVKAEDRQGIIIADINVLESLNYGTRKSELYLTRNEYMLARAEKLFRRQGIPYRGANSPYTAPTGYAAKAFRAIAALHPWRTTPLATKDWRKIKGVLRPTFVDLIHDKYPAVFETRKEGIPPLNKLFRDMSEFEQNGWWEQFIPNMNAATTAMFRLVLKLHTLEECLNPTLELSTIHGAKGKEADRVYVCSALTNKLHRGIEHKSDEHRLFYVAVTRTRDELILLHDSDAGHNRYTFPPTEA